MIEIHVARTRVAIASPYVARSIDDVDDYELAPVGALRSGLRRGKRLYASLDDGGSVAFKAWRLRDSIIEGQGSFIMCELEDFAEVDFGEDGEDVVADVENNADLYAANQENTDLINEARMEEAPLRFMGQDVFYYQPLSLN